MKGKRDPWGRLARLIFRERRPVGDSEIQQLQHQIDAGYAKTGRRQRAGNVRDRERTVLVERFGDRLNGPLGKPFLKDCIAELEKPENCCPAPAGGWSVDTVRQLIKKARKPAVAPRPFREPALPDDSDM